MISAAVLSEVPHMILPHELREAVKSRFPTETQRLHWMALSCLGLRGDDMVHVCADMPQLAALLRGLGVECAPKAEAASIVVINRPKEPDLLTKANRLNPGCRLLVYNDEADIDGMTDRCFDLATACIFDRQSSRVLRIFDPLTYVEREAKEREKGRRTRIDSYVHVELADIADSLLAALASRIAALR